MRTTTAASRVNIVLDRDAYKKLHELCWQRVNKDDLRGNLKKNVVSDALNLLYEKEMGHGVLDEV